MTIKLASLDRLGGDVKELCRRITGFDLGSLVNMTLFDSHEAPLLRPLIEHTICVATELQELPLENLSESKLSALREAAKLVELRFRELKGMADVINDRLAENSNDMSNKWAEERESFVGALKNNCEGLLEIAYPLIPFLKIESNGLKRDDEQTEKLIAQLKTTIGSAETEIAGKKQEIEQIMQAARDIAAQAGVAEHAKAFGDISREHALAARWWLIAAASLTVFAAGIALLILFFYPAHGDLKDAATIQPIIGKIVAVSLLYYGALWSGKNYRTHRHLAVLNAHRQSALNTFDAFVRAASGDEQTKNAVLLEATRCIFAPANTGYLGVDEENPSNRIIEIFKMAGSSAPSK